MKKAKGKWRAPADIQEFPAAAGQRVQIRMRDGRCTIKRAGQVDWTAIEEWRFA